MRVNNRLNERVIDVRTETRDGVEWVLKAEPQGGKVPVGVSFFHIQQPYLKHQHDYHYQAKHGQCYTTSPSGFLPAGVAMLEDSMLKFSWKNGQLVIQGQHYSLYPTKDMLLTEFESKVLQTRHMVCDFKAVAEPVDIPDPSWPTDLRMCIVVVALNILSETYNEPNTDSLAWAYSHHIGSTDVAYEVLLEDTRVLPFLAAIAMEQRSQPETVREIDMCNDIKTDLDSVLGYTPVLYGDKV